MKEFIVRNQLALFFALTIPIGWFWWAQMVLGLWPMEYIIIPSSLGGLSPILVLVILQKLSAQQVDIDGIFKTAKVGKIHLPWLVIAAFVFPILVTIGNLLNFLLGFESSLILLASGPDALGWALIAIIPITFFPGLITSPFFEEPAWRGFALPKLQAKFGREIGSLLVGSYWWLWHQMSNIAFGNYPSILGYLAMLGWSFGIDSMYNLSKRNLLVAMFAHESMFIVFTYLFQTSNYFASILILGLQWTLVLFLRICERKRGKNGDDISSYADRESEDL
ncbi:CPBP family intramembrane metalloprotease [Candidatus Thorarchaeota archaeon]|nr:MAG: CPBP family intramembrane metalloprotease [Candidatus Thorarchaeota archaeon]